MHDFVLKIESNNYELQNSEGKNPNEVSKAPGLVIGGALGTMFGPVGLAIGALAGGIFAEARINNMKFEFKISTSKQPIRVFRKTLKQS